MATKKTPFIPITGDAGRRCVRPPQAGRRPQAYRTLPPRQPPPPHSSAADSPRDGKAGGQGPLVRKPGHEGLDGRGVGKPNAASRERAVPRAEQREAVSIANNTHACRQQVHRVHRAGEEMTRRSRGGKSTTMPAERQKCGRWCLYLNGHEPWSQAATAITVRLLAKGRY